MFALPESLSHVTSAAFAQARLRLGSGSAQAQLSQLRHGAVKTHLTRNHQLLTRGPKRPLLLWLRIPNMLLIDAEIAIQEVVFVPL